MRPVQTNVFLFFSIILLASSASATSWTIKQTKFTCDKYSANPGDTVSCHGVYEIVDGATCTGITSCYRDSEIIEACIRPSVGWLQAFSVPTGGLGQCFAGETFCNAMTVWPEFPIETIYNTVGGNPVSPKGIVFTVPFKMIVPHSGQLTNDGRKAFVDYGALYDIALTSVNHCCNTPGCNAVGPYGWLAPQYKFTIIDPTMSGDADKDGITDSLESSECRNTPLNTKVFDATTSKLYGGKIGCEMKIWEACKQADGTYVCKGSSNLNLIQSAIGIPQDIQVKSICSSNGLEGTGSGWLTEDRCNSAITGSRIVKWEMCTDSTCESKEVLPGAATYYICESKSKTGTGTPYYDTSEECENNVPCFAALKTICPDGTEITSRECISGKYVFTDNKCPEPQVGGKDCGTDVSKVFGYVACGRSAILGEQSGVVSQETCKSGWCLD